MSGREFVDTNIWLYALVEPQRAPDSDKHRRAVSFSFWDSLIVAAALDAGCSTLYSEDMQHGQVIDGRLTIFNPLLA